MSHLNRIVIQACIEQSKGVIDTEALEAYIRSLGRTSFCTSVTEVKVMPIEKVSEMRNEVILMIPLNDDEPYTLVSKVNKYEGVEVDEDQLKFLQTGVCVAMHIDYPRASRYGIPAYAGHTDHAEAFIANHGFHVTQSGIDLQLHDSNDDSQETVWLTIRTPS